MNSASHNSATASFLARGGIRVAFVIPGADIESLVRALRGHEEIRLIPVTSEAAAATMAEGYCRASGRPAVVLGCGGPGLSSLLPFIAQASASSLPIVYLSGLASLRQDEVGWPCSDTALVAAAGCKSILIRDASDFQLALQAIQEAVAQHRPLHLSITAAAQNSPALSACEFPAPKPAQGQRPWTSVPRLALVIGTAAIHHAEALRRLVQDKGIPVATDMTARGIVPEDNPLALGHLSFMGPTEAWDALVSADSVHVLAPSADLLAELRRRQLHFEIIAQRELLAWINWAKCAADDGAERRQWVAGLARPRHLSSPAPGQIPTTHGSVVRTVAGALGPDTVHVLDAGVFHQAGARHLLPSQPRTVISTDCLTIMGWSLGAALGAALAQPGRLVVAYLGDGSFHIQGLSLSLAARLGLPVLFIVGVNGVYASSRKRHPEGPEDPALLPSCDIPAVAQACGVPGRRCADIKCLRAEVEAWASAPSPLLLSVNVGIADPSLAGVKTGIPSLDSSHG